MSGTSVAWAERLLAAAERHADLGAFVTLDHDRALRAASRVDARTRRGPLHGMPVAVKDNIHVAGMPNTAGTAALTDLVPDADAPAVRRLVAAGAFVVGKTAMHELAFGVTSASSASGPVRNAHDPDRIAGGSSGGSAVAVAYGAPAALGTDTGGSVRIPAAFNGVCALRPTTGRYPAGATTPLSTTRDTVGVIARTVAELVRLDAVLAADRRQVVVPASGQLRLGLPVGSLTTLLDEHTGATFAHAVDVLRASGVTFVHVDATGLDDVEADAGLAITLYEAARKLPAYLARHRPGLTVDELVARVTCPEVRHTFTRSLVNGAPETVPRYAYLRALARRRRLTGRYRAMFLRHSLGALVFPTTSCCAAPLAVTSLVDPRGRPAPVFATYVRNTAPGSVAGLPGLTLPAPVPAGTPPVGLALDGLPGTDRALLGIGIELQRVLAAGAAV